MNKITYEDSGFDQYFNRSIRTKQLPIEVIPDFTGVNLDRILESIPIESILPTGSLYSANKKVELNLKDGYLEFLDDKNSEAIRFGQQSDGTFGFFIRKHTGDQIMDEEGIKDTSIALRTDIEKLASEPQKETQVSSLPFFVKENLQKPYKYIYNSDWVVENKSKITFNIRGKGIGYITSSIIGWANGKELNAKHSLDGTRIGTEGRLQQSIRETLTIASAFELDDGEHTIAIAHIGLGLGTRFRLEKYSSSLLVLGKEISIS